MSEAVVIAIAALLLQEPVKDIYFLTKEVTKKNMTKIAIFFSFLFGFVTPIAIIFYSLKYLEFDKQFVLVVVSNAGFLLLNIVLKSLRQVRERIYFEGVNWRNNLVTLQKQNIQLHESTTELAKQITYLLEEQIAINQEKLAITEEERAGLEKKKAKLESTLEQIREIDKKRPYIVRKL